MERMKRLRAAQLNRTFQGQVLSAAQKKAGEERERQALASRERAARAYSPLRSYSPARGRSRSRLFAPLPPRWPAHRRVVSCCRPHQQKDGRCQVWCGGSAAGGPVLRCVLHAACCLLQDGCSRPWGVPSQEPQSCGVQAMSWAACQPVQ